MNMPLGGTFADFMEIASGGKVYSGKSTYGSTDDGWFLGEDSGEPAFKLQAGDRYLSYKPSTGLVVDALRAPYTLGDNVVSASSELAYISAGLSPEFVLVKSWRPNGTGSLRITYELGPSGEYSDLEIRQDGNVLLSRIGAIDGVYTDDITLVDAREPVEFWLKADQNDDASLKNVLIKSGSVAGDYWIEE